MRTADWHVHLHRLAGGTEGREVPDLPPDATLLAGSRGEQVLWRHLAGDPSADPEPVLLRAASGPILAPDAFLAIEVWAECELAAIHAGHRVCRLRGPAASAPLRARLATALRWHLEHTQPDNSTNRPWAIHAFLLADDGSGEAALYAETLLGNMLATHARDEALSQWILADAARELRLAT